MTIVPDYKQCRKCGNRIAKQYIYCKPCYYDFKQWLRASDHRVQTFELAGHNDYYGYEDKPAMNGEKRNKFPKSI